MLMLLGLLKKCSQMLMPMRASVSYGIHLLILTTILTNYIIGIFANKKPTLTSHSYRSNELPQTKPMSTIGTDALKFIEKGYEDYPFEEDYGLKEAVNQSSIILELLEDIQQNKKSKFNSNDDIDRLDNLRSQISYERLVLASKSKQKKMLLRRLKKIEDNVGKLHKEVLKLRSRLYGMITMGNENEINVTCKADFDALNELVKDLEGDVINWNTEVDNARRTLEMLRNDEFDISYNDEGKVTYKEKVWDSDNNIIKVIIQMNDDVNADVSPKQKQRAPTIIEPTISVDIATFVENRKKKEEDEQPLFEKLQQPLMELLDVQMKPSEDENVVIEELYDVIEELKPTERWIPTSNKDIPEKRKFLLKRKPNDNKNDNKNGTRSTLHEPKHKAVLAVDKSKSIKYNVVVINNNDAFTIQERYLSLLLLYINS